MSKQLFTDKQIEVLKINEHVSKVTNKTIDFKFDFKEHIILYCSTLKEAIDYFEECGVGIDILGKKRIEQNYYRWNRQFNMYGNVKFILDERGKGNKKYTPGTEEFEQLSAEEQLIIVKKELAEEKENNRLLKKYMPSWDGTKVSKD